MLFAILETVFFSNFKEVDVDQLLILIDINTKIYSSPLSVSNTLYTLSPVKNDTY